MFYPKEPKVFNRISWVIKETGWEPKPWYWQPGTYMDFEDQGPGINRYCRDVSKSNVDRIFTDVFGYSSFVDPGRKGKAVIKSEENAVHDGRIVERPYNLKNGEICQRFIDSGLKEYRVVIVGGEVACVMIKEKHDVFSSAGCSFSINLPSVIDEITGIELFCDRIGMDYGELDFLRDKDDRGYIIDANHCPGGGTLPNFLSRPKEELTYFIECHRPLFK